MIPHWTLLFTWLALGCASKSTASLAEMASPPTSADYAFEAEGMPAPSARGLDTVGRGDLTAAPPPAEIRPSSATPDPTPARKVHYEGWARMRVTRPDETLDAIADVATAAGGRVDRLTGSDVTVRVPVAEFDATWAAVLALGDVLDKSVRADDITEQFMAVDLRVRTLRTMRDRLVRLLGRAKSDEEKLALLQQITRVTEELDRTESRLRTLRDLAAMSTIRIEALPRETFAGTRQRGEYDGFAWIGALSPFNHGVWSSEKRIPLTSPDEMVALSKTGPYIAEGADGTVLWTMRVPNDPMGSSAFWAAAILDRFGDEFDDIEQSQPGGWACLELREPGAEDPYRWDVCVRDAGRHLNVAQAFYPGAEQIERYAPDVADSLRSAGGES